VILTKPWVFDHTALVALFQAQDDVYRIWETTERELVLGVFPASAVAEANHVIGATYEAWSAILGPADGAFVPLDGVAAAESSRFPGGFAARHVVHTARAVGGVIVTRAPWQYPPQTPTQKVA